MMISDHFIQQKFSVCRISGGFPDGTDGFSDIQNSGNFRKCGITEYVTLHHRMSQCARWPFQCFFLHFLKVNSMLFTMVKTIFTSELVAELHVFEYGGTAYNTFEKTYFKF